MAAPQRDDQATRAELPDTDELDSFPEIDSEIVNRSYSTRAPKIRPRFFRWVRYHSEFKLLFYGALVLLGIGVVLWGGGMELSDRLDGPLAGIAKAIGVIGFLMLLLGIGVALLLRWLWKHTAIHFANALLTPGIVISREPLRVAVLANISNGVGKTYHGVRRLDLPALPVHEHEPGTRVPFSTTFREGDHAERWGDFNPEPICFGTGDRKAINECLSRIDGEEFDALELCIRSDRVPASADEILVLDEDFQVLETVKPRKSSASDE